MRSVTGSRSYRWGVRCGSRIAADGRPKRPRRAPAAGRRDRVADPPTVAARDASPASPPSGAVTPASSGRPSAPSSPVERAGGGERPACLGLPPDEPERVAADEVELGPGLGRRPGRAPPGRATAPGAGRPRAGSRRPPDRRRPAQPARLPAPRPDRAWPPKRPDPDQSRPPSGRRTIGASPAGGGPGARPGARGAIATRSTRCAGQTSLRGIPAKIGSIGPSTSSSARPARRRASPGRPRAAVASAATTSAIRATRPLAM